MHEYIYINMCVLTCSSRFWIPLPQRRSILKSTKFTLTHTTMATSVRKCQWIVSSTPSPNVPIIYVHMYVRIKNQSVHTYTYMYTQICGSCPNKAHTCQWDDISSECCVNNFDIKCLIYGQYNFGYCCCLYREFSFTYCCSCVLYFSPFFNRFCCLVSCFHS